MKQLKEKAKFVQWDRKKEYYTVVSKSGFTKEAEDFAKQNKFLLFDLKDIEKIIQSKNIFKDNPDNVNVITSQNQLYQETAQAILEPAWLK